MFSWIAQGFINVVNAITSIIDYINPFSESFILKPIIDGLLNILDYLNPFSENFILKLVIEGIFTIIDYLNPFSDNFFVKHLINALQDLFVYLFVPSEDSFKQITNVFNEKLGFVDSIKIAIESVEDIIFHNITPESFLLYEVDTPIYKGELSIDFAWFAKFKPYTDLFLTGFIYLGFIWRLYRRLPSIISGTVV